jgi:Flp pilus assembly protein TadG
MVFRHLTTVSKVAMLERIRSQIAARLHRLTPTRVARRFARHQKGAAAVEFALVAVPFLALLFAIIETALVFYAGQVLETAASDMGRMVMTGQGANWSVSDFQKQLCGTIQSNGTIQNPTAINALFKCQNIGISVQNYKTSFANAATGDAAAPPVANGNIDPTNLPFSPVGPSCVVAVQLYYQWPIYVSLLGDSLANFGSDRLLVATSVFRTEPYGPAAC